MKIAKYAILSFSILLLAAACQPQSNVSDSGQTKTGAWENFNDSLLGVNLNYPVKFQSAGIAEAEAYPKLSYERPISGFLAAAQIRPQSEAGSYPSVAILLYRSNGVDLRSWLNARQDFKKGFADQKEVTVGRLKFQKFTGPAGDLVPSSMFIIENGNYVYQFNIDFGLSGRAAKVSAEEILQTLNFKKPQAISPKTPVKIYFLNQKIKPVKLCNEVVAVDRQIEKTEKIATAALNELLKGPSEKEKTQGYFSNIPAGSKLNSLSIKDGEAFADFNETAQSGGGSCSMSARVKQITETLKQFPTIKKVKISINGRADGIFQP